MSRFNQFDVLVIGGGHAGIEASAAAARIGCRTLLITHNIDTIGQMSCNPAIGGIGKGHLVKEIDAMGGMMAQAIDQSGIQFRTLNASRGPAVRATRAQADRHLYRKSIKYMLENQRNLLVFQQEIIDLIIKSDRVIGAVTKVGIKFYANAVVLTAGTFLNGRIYIGVNNYTGGRLGDSSSVHLSNRLRDLSFCTNRLKTGTPPRIDKRSIDFKKLDVQNSEFPLPIFSFLGTVNQHPKQVPCYITHTNEKTHSIVNKNLNKSPMYNGLIKGISPRYCPSIEDKVTRFSEKSSHQIFLEPEGLFSNEIYPNGISTSLPFDIQLEIVRSIKGLENAHITRPGYAIEYDFFDPCDLYLTLESKLIKGLFLAGQINGTTGYEEAGSQGLLAGLNAARFSTGKEGWFPLRNQAYIGVLIDDLCTLGTQEPYRMFTSRAEYRLFLREDNADLRLTEIARNFGMINEVRWRNFCIKQEKIEIEKQRLRNTWIYPGSIESDKIYELTGHLLTHKINGEDLLRRPEINYMKLTCLDYFAPSELLDKQITDQVEIQIKYHGYISRQKKEVANQLKNENTLIPASIDFSVIPGLSTEVISKLSKYRPHSVGQASRISGITPAAISILLIWLKKREYTNI